MQDSKIKQLNQEEILRLTSRYGSAVPRYTSYPTAPEWKQEYSQSHFERAIKLSNFGLKIHHLPYDCGEASINEEYIRAHDDIYQCSNLNVAAANDYSLYLHLPFCESQCYYCGCNVIIAKEHGIEEAYLQRLKEEIEYIGKQIDPQRRVVQMAWGGGTPTYLRPEQIRELYEHIAKYMNLYQASEQGHEYSIEIDPRVTSREQLETLFELGFNRLSLGVQDFNPQTQEAINRIQSFEMVEAIVAEARDVGFKSVNFDLIYGLPYQSLETFAGTVEQVKAIDPERIALFNYAHIPSMLPFQRKYIDEATLPSQEEKLKVFCHAREEFEKHGYEFIGLDHFAKPDDELAIAQREGTLYRNFQGYTTHSGCDLFGLGVTAISDVAGVYKQNYKKLNQYYGDFGADKFLECCDDDLERREIIKQLMCNNRAILDAKKYSSEIEALKSFVEEGLLNITDLGQEQRLTQADLVLLEVRDAGRYVVRNIASAFDAYLKTGHKVFSKSL